LSSQVKVVDESIHSAIGFTTRPSNAITVGHAKYKTIAAAELW
jgi:hypothetical protein